MAKPRPVPNLDPDRGLRPNARRILAVRIDEVYSYDGLVMDPSNVTELHDMRIACKRLRYLLEIFAVAFGGDLKGFTDQVAALQDVLGDIHDCDVQIPMLEQHLAWLLEREAGATQRLVIEAAARRASQPGLSTEAAFRDFQRELEVGLRGDERPGVHALIARSRHRRDELYVQFLDEWRRLKAERFRARLERELGIKKGS
jgi:CHAD domain